MYQLKKLKRGYEEKTAGYRSGSSRKDIILTLDFDFSSLYRLAHPFILVFLVATTVEVSTLSQRTRKDGAASVVVAQTCESFHAALRFSRTVYSPRTSFVFGRVSPHSSAVRVS